MASRTGFTAVAAVLVLAGCGSASDRTANDAAAAPATRAKAPVTAPPPAQAPAAAATYTLSAGGLTPGLAFGMARDPAVAAATAAFGPATAREHNDECGEGPMDFVSFRGLQLGFQGGRLVGWSMSEAEPALRTGRGLAIGAPRSALGGAEVDEQSSLGPEFEVDGVGGILDQHGTRIEALWAGMTCQFR